MEKRKIFIVVHSSTAILIFSKYLYRDRESQILDYQVQQYKLFPVIAMALVYKFAAQWLWEEYSTVSMEISAGDLKHLPEVGLIFGLNRKRVLYIEYWCSRYTNEIVNKIASIKI